MKTEPERNYIIQVINIKLQTQKEGDQKYEAYKSLIQSIKGKHARVAENQHMILYNIFDRKIESSQTEYQYGNLGKGIFFDSEEITNIGISELTPERTHPDKSMIQASKSTLYFFIPSIHKFCLINKDGINANNTLKYLLQVLTEVADKEDIVEVELIKEPKITEDLLSAFAIHSLDYEISYTNDDPTSTIDKLFDNRLKRLQIGDITVKMKADHNGSLNTEEKDELIEGGIRLAEQNGTINEAVITRKRGGKRMTVTNKDKPRRISIQANDNNLKEVIVTKILSLFSKLL